MKQLINEFRRMQQLAGLMTEGLYTSTEEAPTEGVSSSRMTKKELKAKIKEMMTPMPDGDTRHPNAYTDDIFNHNSEISPDEKVGRGRMYFHVLEDGGYGNIGHQGVYDTKEEAQNKADKLADMFPDSSFYVEASDSKDEPYNVTMEENKEVKLNTKMKKSELKTKIKEMILKEMESNNMEDAPENEVDFLAELEGMLNEEDGLTPLQDYVYQYEIEISGEDEAQDFLDDIKQLKTPQDVYDYYAYDRDWSGSDLNNIFRQVKRKFANLITTDDLTPLQRTAYSYTKERFGNAEAKKSLDLIKTFKTQQEFNDWVDIKIKDEDDFNKAKRAKEGTTLKEVKDDENGLTPLQKYIYNYEKDISGEDEAQQFLDDIKKLNTPDDVYDYYAYDRDWEGSMDDDLNNIFKQVSKKFKNLGEGLYEAEGLTPLQQYIYDYETEVSGDDFADEELENIKKLNTPDEVYDYYAEDRGWENDKDLYPELKRLYKILVKKFSNLSEAKAKDKETDTEEVTDDVTDGEETVDVTDDFSTEEPQGPGGIDVTQNASTELTGAKKEVQDNLEAALEAARKLGDEKLTTQVGNTITFFNKQHVVKDTPVAENINEAIEFFEMDSEFEGAMEAGDQTEEEYLRDIIDTPSPQIDLSGYYEVENAVDQGDYSKGQAIKLMKSWAKDKMNELGLDESKNINEVMFPMLKKILK